jgi:hypothetical protein
MLHPREEEVLDQEIHSSPIHETKISSGFFLQLMRKELLHSSTFIYV